MYGQRSELSSLAERDGVAQSRSKQINTKLRNRGTIYLCKFHFQQYFLRSYGAKRKHIDNILRVGFRDQACPLGSILSRDMTREHNGRPGGCHRNTLVWEDPLDFFDGSGYVHIYSQIETT